LQLSTKHTSSQVWHILPGGDDEILGVVWDTDEHGSHGTTQIDRFRVLPVGSVKFRVPLKAMHISH